MHLQNFVRAFVFTTSLALSVLILPAAISCQTEKLGDIKYTPVKGWTKTTKDHAVVFSEVDKASGKFCFITLYAASPGTGSPQKDFAREWNERVVRPWSGEADPKTEIEASDGWTTIAGGGQIDFGGNKAIAFLTVVSGFGKSVSVLGVLNDEAYLPKLVAFNSALYIERGSVAAVTVTPTREQPVAASAAASPVMNINGLAREFQDNEVRANQTWIGKRVRVIGTVNTVVIARDGNVEVTFKTSVTNNNMAKCFFSQSQSSGVVRLTAHTEAIVEGTVKGLGGGFDNSKAFFLLESCVVP